MVHKMAYISIITLMTKRLADASSAYLFVCLFIFLARSFSEKFASLHGQDWVTGPVTQAEMTTKPLRPIKSHSSGEGQHSLLLRSMFRDVK